MLAILGRFPAIAPAVICLTLMLAVSCTSNEVSRGPAGPASPSLSALTQGTGTPADLAGLPAPRSLLRQPLPTLAAERSASLLSENGLQRGGDDFDITFSNNLAINGNAADFSPATGSRLADQAYGLYRFDATDYNRQSELRLRWNDSPAGGSLWLGLGNFASNRWDWIRPASDDLITLDVMSPLTSYISASGELFAVVLLTGDAGASLDALRLGDPLMNADFRNTAGAGHFTVWAPTTGLTYKSSSSIATGSIVNHDWDLDGDGDFETDTDAVDEVQNASLDLGLTNVSLRITSDWGTQATGSHPLRGLAGAWNVYQLTDNLNDSTHQTTVRTPQLLGSRADSGELPLIIWSQLDIEDPMGSPAYRTRMLALLGDDPTLESWSPAAPAADVLGLNYSFFIEDAARLSDGSCGLAYRSDFGDNTLGYLRSSDPSATAWQDPVLIGNDVDSEGGATLEVFNGDLFCAYIHHGTTDMRKNIGTTSADWEAAVNIDQASQTRYAYYKPALAIGLQWPTLDQQLYCCAESLSQTGSTTQPVYYNSDPAGSSFLYQHALDNTNPSGQSMTGASFHSHSYAGSLRSIFAYKQFFTGELRYIYDDPTALFTGQLSNGVSLGLPAQSLGELHLAGSEDNINNLADVFLVYSISGGGLLGFEYLEDSGWHEPGPESGSSSIEPADPGDAGSQPCCAWIMGRPAVVYVDYASQNIKFAILN